MVSYFGSDMAKLKREGEGLVLVLVAWCGAVLPTIKGK